MKALVLAAGKGERLRPLTETVPKPLLEVGGRPIIHYPLQMLKRAGITQIAINVYHLAGQIEMAVGDGRSLGVQITYAPETVLLGSGGPLPGLRGFFGAETFAVANADTILDLELRTMIEFHRARGALATFALCRPDNLDAYSHLEIDGDGRLCRIRLRSGGQVEDLAAQPPAQGAAAPQPYVFCGVYLCEPKVYEMMPPAPPFSSMRDLFAPMLVRGMPLFGYVHRGLFRTIDDLEAYEALKQEFAANPPPLGD